VSDLMSKEQLKGFPGNRRRLPGLTATLPATKGGDGRLEHGLSFQRLLVAALFGMVMALAAVCALAAEPAGTATASVHVSVVIKPVSRVTVLHQQSRIEITSQHVAQGYIELPVASRIEVRNNISTGSLLSIENSDGPFRDISVSGFGNEVRLQSGNNRVHIPYTPVPKKLELSYRFTLAADARPGSYPWPLQIAAIAR
jgi:hypothetical protein